MDRETSVHMGAISINPLAMYFTCKSHPWDHYIEGGHILHRSYMCSVELLSQLTLACRLSSLWDMGALKDLEFFTESKSGPLTLDFCRHSKDGVSTVEKSRLSRHCRRQGVNNSCSVQSKVNNNKFYMHNSYHCLTNILWTSHNTAILHISKNFIIKRIWKSSVQW